MLYNKRHIFLRSPLRISFVGGGTDIAAYYGEGDPGHVVSASINLFNYVTLKDMFDANVRVHHAEIETESITSRIKHNYARTALEYFGLFRGLEVILTSDVMTTGSGLGASSAMMSALITGCNELRGNKPLTPGELAELTYRLEHESGTVGGKQDQYATAFGGLNAIEFGAEKVVVNPVTISRERLELLQDRLILIFTNLSRESKKIQMSLNESAKNDKRQFLNELKAVSFEFLEVLKNESADINNLGKMLHQAWEMKKASNSASSNPFIDQLYETLLSKGVLGGKVLGAGGGGFLLAFAADPSQKDKIKYDLYPNFIAMDVKFNPTGTQVLWKNF